MFLSGVTRLPRYLVTYEADPDLLGLIELDDANFLSTRNYRPSDIVARNRTRTQEVALELWLEGIRTLRWWSYYRPEWRIISVWADIAESEPWNGLVQPIDVVELHIDHPAVEVAAEVLAKERS
jgi:hypothetical protein